MSGDGEYGVLKRIVVKEGSMDVGVLVTATAESGDLSAVARRAEALGFASLWIPEHPVIPVGHTIYVF